MNDPKIKQQIVEKIKDSTNILVTVSNDPSVDELAAALGLTMMLNKIDKHATAVFSGQIPPAITFLDPEKTFESTADSLRDFIIALDKEKADHLRYKLEGDVVKIFITPYRTTITSEDLEFSQGDYNVELVLALGVENKDHLDAALEAHGRILHDATVVTLSAGEQVSNLGSLDWRDENASSLSEMLVSLSESVKADKKLLDKSIATAFLTGIVAATDRFSNTRTSSRVMTMAAQLMAAGADQQLIAARLEESHEISDNTQDKGSSSNEAGETTLKEGESKKLPKQLEAPKEKPKKDDGSLVISHEKKGSLEEVAKAVQEENLEAASRVAERALEKQEEIAAATEPQAAPETSATPPVEQQPLRGAVDWKPGSSQLQQVPEPSFGGTLNATTEQAEEDKRRAIEKDQNRTILSHSYIGGEPTYDAPINAAMDTREQENAQSVDIFNEGTPSTGLEPPAPAPARAEPIQPPTPEPVVQPVQETVPTPAPEPAIPTPQPPAVPTLAQIDAENRAMSHDEARAAVEAALSASPAPAADPGLPLPPPLPDFSTLPPPPAPGAPSAPQGPGQSPQILGDILASDGNSLPPAPAPAPTLQTPPVAPPQPTDPGQFRIPGQQ